MSESCDKVKDVLFLAKEPIPQAFLKRLQCIPIADIQKRIDKAHQELSKHCDYNITPCPEGEEPEETPCCPIMVTTTETLKSMYLIKVEDLDSDVQELMATLEAETCDTLEKLEELENLIANEGCWEG